VARRGGLDEVLDPILQNRVLAEPRGNRSDDVEVCRTKAKPPIRNPSRARARAAPPRCGPRRAPTRRRHERQARGALRLSECGLPLRSEARTTSVRSSLWAFAHRDIPIGSYDPPALPRTRFRSIVRLGTCHELGPVRSECPHCRHAVRRRAFSVPHSRQHRYMVLENQFVTTAQITRMATAAAPLSKVSMSFRCRFAETAAAAADLHRPHQSDRSPRLPEPALFAIERLLALCRSACAASASLASSRLPRTVSGPHAFFGQVGRLRHPGTDPDFILTNYPGSRTSRPPCFERQVWLAGFSPDY
jgi:hypothetical protein